MLRWSSGDIVDFHSGWKRVCNVCLTSCCLPWLVIAPLGFLPLSASWLLRSTPLACSSLLRQLRRSKPVSRWVVALVNTWVSECTTPLFITSHVDKPRCLVRVRMCGSIWCNECLEFLIVDITKCWVIITDQVLKDEFMSLFESHSCKNVARYAFRILCQKCRTADISENGDKIQVEWWWGNPPSESSRTHTLSGMGVDFPVDNLDTNLTTSNGYYAMPRPEYLIR